MGLFRNKRKNKRRYCLSKMVCPVCYRFVINHLPWELLSCYDKNPEWYAEVLGLPLTLKK